MKPFGYFYYFGRLSPAKKDWQTRRFKPSRYVKRFGRLMKLGRRWERRHARQELKDDVNAI